RLAPPVQYDRLRGLSAGPVEAVERAGRKIDVELRPIVGELLAQAIEYLDRQTTGIGSGLQHDRRDGADQHQLRYPTLWLTVPGDIARGLPAAGRMAYVHGIHEIEMLNNRGGIRRIMIHVMTVADLHRAAVPATVMRDDAIAVA